MIKFYLELQSKIFSKKLYYGIAALAVAFNIVLRIIPEFFIHINTSELNFKIIPAALYSYCDVYFLMIFIVLLYFSLGIDFYNKMEELTLSIGGAKFNRYAAKKFISLLAAYIPLYLITYLNIYFLYKVMLPKNQVLISFGEMFFYSLVSNIFILSLALFILFLTRDIPVSMVIITSVYLIEEYLWRAQITKQYGILGHIYYYNDSFVKALIIIKVAYLICSVILFAIILKLSSRKNTSLLARYKL